MSLDRMGGWNGPRGRAGRSGLARRRCGPERPEEELGDRAWPGKAQARRVRLRSVPRAEKSYGRIHRRFNDLPDGSSIFDGKRGQFTQAAQQDHGQRRSQRRQVSPPEAWAGAEVDQLAGQQLQPAALDGTGDGTERREFTNPAQCDGWPGFDMSDVGLDRLTNLSAPISLGIDRCQDAFAEFLDVVLQQLQEALFLTGELVVEGALGRARVADNVCDCAGAVSTLADRGGEAVEQSEPKRVWFSQLFAENGVAGHCCHARAPFDACHVWYYRVPYRERSAVLRRTTPARGRQMLGAAPP
jgi:hypothetical protein